MTYRRPLRESRRDRQAWASARTLADVGDLTARWLEGDLASQPGYERGAGPDTETTPLIPVLAACCRAGFVTNGSQPGEPVDDGFGQRAAVEGFASPEAAARIAACLPDGLIMLTGRAGWRMRWRQAVVVTMDGGRPFTRFGVVLSRRHLADSWVGYGSLHPDAVRALQAAVQVTVVDPEWGRNDRLWPALAAFAGACVPVVCPAVSERTGIDGGGAAGNDTNPPA